MANSLMCKSTVGILCRWRLDLFDSLFAQVNFIHIHQEEITAMVVWLPKQNLKFTIKVAKQLFPKGYQYSIWIICFHWWFFINISWLYMLLYFHIRIHLANIWLICVNTWIMIHIKNRNKCRQTASSVLIKGKSIYHVIWKLSRCHNLIWLDHDRLYTYHSGLCHWPWWRHQMQTFFRVTGPLWGESIGQLWIPLKKAGDAELWCYPWPALSQTTQQTIETPVIWDAIALIMMSL